MIETIIILWLLCGAISVWRLYHGFLKYFYAATKKSLWSIKEGREVLLYILIVSPIIILGGMLTTFSIEFNSSGMVWWFNTKNK